MNYREERTLKDGSVCLLRQAGIGDTQTVLDLYLTTHRETDYLLSYPDEKTLTLEEEGKFLEEMEQSEREIEILAFIEGTAVGCAGIHTVGRQEKLRHRAEFGVSVLRDYWGLGIGRALTRACIRCAQRASYAQLELDVVGENRAAIALYEKEGFETYGRNPLGFRSRYTGWQELLLMRRNLELPVLGG